MPIIIKRPDLEPKRETYEYDKIVGVIILVVVGLWIVADILGILLLGTIEGFVVKYAPDLKEDLAEVNTLVALAFLKTFGFGAWYALCGIGIRNGLKYGFWLVYPASIALLIVNKLPTDETLFAESVFALVAMGYCSWRLFGKTEPKPH